MRQGGLILAAGRVRSKKKKHESTGNSLIVAHTKREIKKELYTDDNGNAMLQSYLSKLFKRETG